MVTNGWLVNNTLSDWTDDSKYMSASVPMETAHFYDCLCIRELLFIIHAGVPNTFFQVICGILPQSKIWVLTSSIKLQVSHLDSNYRSSVGVDLDFV